MNKPLQNVQYNYLRNALALRAEIIAVSFYSTLLSFPTFEHVSTFIPISVSKILKEMSPKDENESFHLLLMSETSST